MNAPKLSIGLPVYNGDNYLGEAIDSILTQDFSDFELIISDNASTDGTAAICQRYADSDRRIRYIRLPRNQGGARNFNYVYELARGEYFKWAAHDDVCAQGFFRRCVDILDESPGAVLVYPMTQMINEVGQCIPWEIETVACTQPRPHKRLGLVLRELNVLSAQFGVIRSVALRQTRRFDKIVASDYVLLAELAMLGQFIEVPERLFQRRLHPLISTRANASWDDLLVFWDPSQKGRRLRIPPMIRLGYEYLLSINRLALRPSDKALCYATALYVWNLREFRNWAGRQRRQLTKKIRSHREASTDDNC